ncbi:hypothetical protein M378DRAFT_163750 [Amanita muscaria Koide BX008]|uniref:Uncharacterized protein n=1 Tax=Amanita muscaria (strain Koide BX008) TaxID=946122 RepID=A0A0C2X453_AMAMK|nr:hypothetical protein M378DRAFT_163750 [Amanita muscaria Koide BX008]
MRFPTVYVRAEWFKLHLCLAADKRSQLQKNWLHPEPAEGPGENDALGIERVGGGEVEGSRGTGGERDGSNKEGLWNTLSREV